MRVTPLDIRKQEFKKTMRGLDADEVYAFLNTVAEEYEIVLSDNKKLRERIVELEERLNEYKNIEKNLRNTLLTAERLTAEAKENAKREASLIIKEAEMEAEKAAEAIRAQTQRLRREILELKKHKDNYIARLKTWLGSHMKMIDGFEEDFAAVDKDIENIGRKVESETAKVQQNRRMSRERITEGFSHEAKGKATWDEERKREEEQRPTVPRPEWQKKPAQSKEAKPESSRHEPSSSDSQRAVRDNSGMSKQEKLSDIQVPPLKTEPIGAITDEMKPGSQTRSQADAPLEQEGESWEEHIKKEDVARTIEERLYPEHNVESMGTGSPDMGNETATSPGGQEGAGLPNQVEPGNPPGARPDAPTEISGASATELHDDQWKQYDVREEEPDWKSYEVPVDGASSEYKQAESNSHPQGAHSPEEAASPGGVKEDAKESSAPDEMEVEEALSGLREVAETEEGSWSMEELKKNLTNLNQNDGD